MATNYQKPSSSNPLGLPTLDNPLVTPREQPKSTTTNITPEATAPIPKPSIPKKTGGGGGRSTISTPTPSAETLTGTTEQREQQIQNYQTQLPQSRTVAQQFTQQTTKQPTGETTTLTSVPGQYLPGIRSVDTEPLLVAKEDKFYEAFGKLYKETTNYYKSGAVTYSGYNVWDNKNKFVEYKNPLGTTSTLKLSGGETIYYNPAGGYGTTTSKTVPEGSFEVNVQGERLFGGKTSEQLYKQQYEQASYLGKVKIGLISAATPENPFNIPSIVDTITGKGSQKERIKTTLSTSLYKESGQAPRTFKEFTTRSPIFYAGVVAPTTGLAISGGAAILSTIGAPFIAKNIPQAFTTGTRLLTSATISQTILPTLAQGVAYSELERESNIIKRGGTAGDVIGDITVQGVEIATATTGMIAGAKAFAKPFSYSQPQFKSMEFTAIGPIKEELSTEGNLLKKQSFYGIEQASFEGSIIPPKTRVATGILETTELPAGNVVQRLSKGMVSYGEYSFVEDKYVFTKPQAFKFGSPIPTSVFKSSAARSVKGLFGITSKEVPELYGSKGVTYITDIETGRTFSFKGTSVSMPIDKETSRFIASTSKSGRISARGTVYDFGNLRPTRLIEPEEAMQNIIGTFERSRAMKPFDLSKPIKTELPSKSITSTSKSAKQVLQPSEDISAFYGQGQYEKTEGGLLPGERLGVRSQYGQTFGAISDYTRISETFVRQETKKIPYGGLLIRPTFQVETESRKRTGFDFRQPTFNTETARATTRTTSLFKQTQGQVSKQTQSQITQQTQTSEFTDTFNYPTPIPPTKITPRFPIIPPITGFSIGETYKYKKQKRKKPKYSYQPSLTSAILGITSSGKPKKYFGGYSPFSRPILISPRRRKATRRKRR